MSNTKGLILAIVFSATLISGSLFYLGRSMDSQRDVAEQIDQLSKDLDSLSENISEELFKDLTESNWMANQLQRAVANSRQVQANQQQQVNIARDKAAREKAKSVRKVTVSRDHIRGNVDAEISLIEYSDFECPYCKRFHLTPAAILADFGDKINWVYRHYPLSFHNPGAQKQAEAAECVAELGGNDAFWEFTDLIYAQTRSGGQGFPLTELSVGAESIGIDVAAFEDCYNSERFASRVIEDFREGASIGITGTPGSILLNNKTGEVIPISGAQGVDVFKSAIKILLKGSS